MWQIPTKWEMTLFVLEHKCLFSRMINYTFQFVISTNTQQNDPYTTVF